MSASISLTFVILLGAASVQPAFVPATAKQKAFVRIERAGMYHISARSESGTACRLVDHQRGPFANAGRVGKTNCELDLLLDEGVYLLRLESPKKARGQVTLVVKQFAELFDKPLNLVRGRADHTTLAPGQQASWWVRVAERRHVALRVLGRTAGLVRLWRDGKWVEEIPAHKSEVTPRRGQPLHSWLLSGTLEAGDYLLTAYGAEPRRWTAGVEADFLFVANGYPEGPADRVTTFNLPDWGRVAIQVPKGRLAAFMALDRAPDSDVLLEVHSMPDLKGDRIGGLAGSCRVGPKALVPICSAFGNQDQRHVLVVTGPPGTTGRLRWAGYHSSSYLADDLYTSPTTSIEFEAPASGRFLVAADDVPMDPDAAPLGCQLEAVRRVRWKKVFRDFMKLGDERMFERSFNYDGRSAGIWFEITKSGVYEIVTGGERESKCELFGYNGNKLSRVAEGCKIEKALGTGHYQLKLYRGSPGIEKLTVRYAESRLPFGLGKKKAGRPVTKNSCLFPGVELEKKGRYRLQFNRTGRLTARGLILRELPLKLERPLPLVVDAGESVSLPVAPGRAIEVRAAGGNDFLCALGAGSPSVARDGVCRLSANESRCELTVSNPGSQSLAVTALRPRPPDKPPVLRAHSPKVRRLPGLEPGQTRFFDFDRGQSHSLTFDVKQAGLYHLSTVGLLASECRVRTPIFPRLASAKGGGRGRNCLVAGFLRPGRYLLTATTVDKSRGRGGVTVVRRPVRDKPGITGEGDAFFRVEPDELVRQKLTVTDSARYTLRTTGQGVSLQCRLEDADGWPLVRVPASCSQTLHLDAGTYLWGQMPLTVESMRKTELAKVREPEVLDGNKPHRIELNRSYTAKLGEDGKDDFRFRLRAELGVYVSLNNGMQGRLFRSGDGNKTELVDVIPPSRHRQRLALKPGAYELVTEHSRADVGIRYRIGVSTTMLAPGLSLSGLPVPGEVVVRMPRAGVLRIKSEGETDVRCRLFDSDGELVTEGSDIGADWNCLTAVPVRAGDFRLVIEAENGIPGSTRISANSPGVKKTGALKHDQVLETGNNVLLAELPRPRNDAVLEVGFTSKLRFSCALEDETGPLQRELNVLRCGFLVHTRGKSYQVRLWTRRWSGKLKVKMVERPFTRMSDGDIPAGKAALVEVERTGLYRTAKQVWCLPADKSGPLRFCGPRASLSRGQVVFSTTGPEREPDLEMEEEVAEIDKRVEQKLKVSSEPNWQRQRSEERALHLLALSVPQGEQAAPACRIAGGVHQQRAHACFAAGGPEKESLGRWWLTSKRPRPARLVRLAARVPESVTPLRPGVHRLVWSGAVARYRLPAGASRVELVLPGDTWAVQTDTNGKALDLCAPAGALNRCVLGATGGELFLVSDAERQARVRLLLVQRPPGREELEGLTGLFERWPLAAGQTMLSVPAVDADRRLAVSGAVHCRTALDDGTRIAGCTMSLPAGTGALVELEHEARPIQAVVAPADEIGKTRWGRETPQGQPAPLLMARTVLLSGELVDRVLKIEKPAVVHLHADAGVCALLSAEGELTVAGDGLGCDVHRLLEPGAWRVMVRAFADKPLGGFLVWTAEPVQELGEGVGLQDWVAPGQKRFYRFRVAAAGKVGLGVRAEADLLACTVMDERQQVLGEGCQQFLELEAGSYLLSVRTSGHGRPMRFRPVLLGLAGTRIHVPEKYLRDFFRRIGFKRNGGER